MEQHKLAWLAGIVDGEGTIGMYAIRRKDTPKGFFYSFQLQISNDDTSIISEITAIIGQLTQGNVKVTVVPDVRPSRQSHHIHYRVSVVSIRGLKTVLAAIEPYLVGKRSQAVVLLQLFHSHKAYTPYSKMEIELINVLKSMKMDNRHWQYEYGNTEPSRDNGLKPKSQACVETIQAVLPLPDSGAKIESDTPSKGGENKLNHPDL